MSCPNKTFKTNPNQVYSDWELLEGRLGKDNAYAYWLALGEIIPTPAEIEAITDSLISEYSKNRNLSEGLNLLRDSKGKLMSSKHVDDFTNTLAHAIFKIRENLKVTNKDNIVQYPKANKIFEELETELKDHLEFYTFYSENEIDESDVANGAFVTKEQNKLVAEYYQHILDNQDKYFDLVKLKINNMGYVFKSGNLKEQVQEIEEGDDLQNDADNEFLDEGESETTKHSFEDGSTFRENTFDKLTPEIKRLLSFIPDVEENILSKESYVPMETVYRTILDVLSNKEITFEESLQVLKDNVIKKPYLQEVINLLEDSELEEDVKIKFNAHFQNNNVTHNTVKFKDTKTGSEVTTFNTNRNSASRVILEEWLTESIKAPVFKTSIEGSVIDKEFIDTTFKDQWSKIKTNGYEISDVKDFLDMIGVNVNIDALEYIKSNSKNTLGLGWEQLFTSTTGNGTFYQIYNVISNTKEDINIEEEHPLETDQQVSKLANIELQFRDSVTTDSFLNGEGKSIFSFINPTWLVNRFHRLVNNTDNIRTTLSNLPIGKYSYYLNGLKNSEFFRKHFNIEVLDTLQHDDFALKFNKMSRREKFVTQINLFVNRQQGKGEEMISKFLTPSKSDKAVLHIMTAQRRKVKSSGVDFKNKTFNANDKEVMLNLVRGEFERIKDAQKKRAEGINFEDIKGYNPFKFYNYSALNDIKELWVGGELIDYEDAESIVWEQVKKDTYKQIEDLRTELTDLGIIVDNKLVNVDSSYTKDNSSVDYFLADYIINYNIAVVNYNILFQGDTAIAAKKTDKDTQANMFKRLAKEIAPARRAAKMKGNSEFQNYKQIFLNDTFSKSLNIEQLQSIFGSNERAINAYSSIEGTDAQELTTLKEHLDVMYYMGKLNTKQYKDLSKKSTRKDYVFSEEELNIVLQPMKPVYVGNKLMQEYGAEIPVYIKSSSFPLVPQLVKGTEFEKLERQMSKHDIKRAVFLTGAKLGAFKPIDLWNKVKDENGEVVKYDNKALTDGTINEEVLDKALKNNQFLTLNRDFFGIQQEVPYDPDKNSILEGSQLSKLILLGLKGKPEVIDKFNQLHIKLVNDSYNNFLNEIGATENEDGTYTFQNIQGFADLLVKELTERGSYSANDLLALELNDAGTDFKIPLWSGPKSAQFEALLNSIINKRVLKQKLAGRSYVLGTEQGFKGKSPEINYIKADQLVGTVYDKTTGLKPQRYGYVKGDSKLEESDYNNLEDKTGYTKVVFPAQALVAKSRYKIKQFVGYRNPTQKENSMSAMEIVGYLPDYMGDLLIAPQDFVKQMGSDFDVDKIYTHRWYENKKGEKYNIENITAEWEAINNKEITEIYKAGKEVEIAEKLASVFNKPEFKYSEEEIQEIIDTISVKYPTKEEYINYRISKLEKNEIVDIYWNTLIDNDNLAQILRPLDNGNLDEVKKVLADIEQDKGITEYHNLSPNYQIDNYENGNAGKFGVSVTSLLSTFNALLSATKNNISIIKTDKNEDPILFKFKINDEIVEVDSLNDSQITLDDLSTKGQVISAFQSVSVDNIKELIIKSVNYNKHTHDAFTTLALLGLNDKYISYFLAQPSIKEFVKEVDNLSDSFSEDRTDKINRAVDAVIKKLMLKSQEQAKINNVIPDINEESIINIKKNWNKPFSEEDLLNNIKNENLYNQAVLLYKFVELSTEGRKINNIVRAIQPATSGIGKNRIVANNKVLMYEEAFSNESITNLKSLITGTITGNGIEILKRSNSLFNSFFKVNDVAIQLAYNVNENRKTFNKALTEKEQQKLVNFTKSYIFSNALHMYYGKDVSTYRHELLFGENNISNKWDKYKKENPDSWLAKRIVLKPTNAPSKPNRIEYRASQVDRNDDVKNTYELIEMLESSNFETRQLAEDTIAYAYLTGGNQDAISLLKFIPITYLNYTKFGEIVNHSSRNIDQSALLEQYLQHNPYHAYIANEEFAQQDDLLLHPDFNGKYVSKKIEYKWHIFKKINAAQEGFVFQKIDNLGTFGAMEPVFDSINTKSNFEFNQAKQTKVEEKSIETVEPSSISQSIVNPKIEIKIKDGVNFVFEKTPELSKIGTKQQYSDYLNTIFPESLTKEIVYHGTANSSGFEIFDESKISTDNARGRGFYFTNDIYEATNWATDFSAQYEGITPSELLSKNKIKIALLNINNVNDIYPGEIVAKNVNQIHVLGSKLDINNFKNFVNTREIIGKKELEDNEEFNILKDENYIDKRDLNIRSKYFPNSNINTIQDVLSRISISNHPLNTLAKQLIKYAEVSNVTLELIQDDGSGTAATYNRRLNKIVIKEDVSFKGLGSEPTILHEIIHALTVKELYSNPNSELTQMYEQAKKFIPDTVYGMKDQYEFVAELFTNANFISKLKDIPAIESNKYTNLLQEFFDKILKILGINKSNTLYEQAFALSTNIIDNQYQKFKLEKESLMSDEFDNSFDSPIFEEYNDQEIEELIKKCK